MRIWNFRLLPGDFYDLYDFYGFYEFSNSLIRGLNGLTI